MDESDTSTVTDDINAPNTALEVGLVVSETIRPEFSVVETQAQAAEGDVRIQSVEKTALFQSTEGAATTTSPTDGHEGVEDTTLTIDDTTDASQLFFVDTTADIAMSNDTPLYETTTTSCPVGTEPSAALHDKEDIVFRPQLIADPVSSLPSFSTSRPDASSAFELNSVYVDPRVALNRKDKKALKRAKRASRKSRKRQEAKMRQDSDIDWGSDMEKAGVVGIEVDELGHRFASAGLDESDQDLEEQDVDPDLDFDDMAKFSRGIGFGHGNGGAVAVDMESDSDDYEELPAKGKAPLLVSVSLYILSTFD